MPLLDWCAGRANPLPQWPGQTAPPGRSDGKACKRVLVRDSPCSPCWATHKKTKLSIVYICVGGLGPVHICVSVSADTPGPRLVASVGLLVELLLPLGPSILPPTLPQAPRALPNVYESQRLFQSADGWDLSRDSCAGLPCAGITEWCQGLAPSHGVARPWLDIPSISAASLSLHIL